MSLKLTIELPLATVAAIQAAADPQAAKTNAAIVDPCAEAIAAAVKELDSTRIPPKMDDEAAKIHKAAEEAIAALPQAKSKYCGDYIEALTHYLHQRGPETIAAAKYNLTDPRLPRYWKIKNIALVVGAGDDFDETEKYRIVGEVLYREAKALSLATRTDHDDKEWLVDLRECLDELKASQLGQGHELHGEDDVDPDLAANLCGRDSGIVEDDLEDDEGDEEEPNSNTDGAEEDDEVVTEFVEDEESILEAWRMNDQGELVRIK